MQIPRKTWVLLAANALMVLFCVWAYSFKPLELSAPVFSTTDSHVVSPQPDTSSARAQPNNTLPTRSLFFLPRRKEELKPTTPEDGGLVILRKLTISGIVIDGLNKMAIVQVDGRARKLHEGEKLGEWAVKTITRKEIVFWKNDRSFIVPLDKPANVSPRAVP